MANITIKDLTAGTPILTDLLIFANPTTGLAKKSTLSTFKSSLTLFFADLSDYAVANLLDEQILFYDSGEWKNTSLKTINGNNLFGLGDIVISGGLTSLNALTASTQTFAVSSTGTDFTISSASSTHTFNLPSASAANRGLLTAANWTTFNNKQAALVSGTNIKTINGQTILGSGDISTATLLKTVDTAANLGTLFTSQYEINYAGTSLSGFANSILAEIIFKVSANTTVESSTKSASSIAINKYQFSTASTITYTQPAGTIRAASALSAYSKFQNSAAGTITHAAGITILGIENLGGSALTINNNYQLLINGSDEFASTANITNRWGIYQNGINDYNYFAGNVLIGTTTPNGNKLQVNGSGYFNSDLYVKKPNSVACYINVGDATNTYSLLEFRQATNFYTIGTYPSGSFHFQNGFNNQPIFTLSSDATATIDIGAGNRANFRGKVGVGGYSNIYTLPNILTVIGNTSIGTTEVLSTANAASVLFSVNSTTQGSIPLPRMTTAQIKAIASPVNGLMAYSIDDFVPCFYDSSVSLWKKLSHTNL